MDDEARTLWCGNLSEKVTEELLYELFLQAAPIARVRIPADRNGRKSNFGFVTLKHEVSVDYAVQLLDGTSLYGRRINVKPRNTNRQPTPQIDLNQLLIMGQMMELNVQQHNQPRNFSNDWNRRDEDRRFRGRHDGHRGRPKWSNNHKNDHYGNDRNRRHRHY